MQKISELKPGAGIELKAEITSIQPIRKLWQCFECKKAGKEDFKGLWKNEQEFKDACPNCGAKELFKCPDKGCSQDIITDGKFCRKCGKKLESVQGKGLWLQEVRSVLIKDDSGMTYLDLWHEDVYNYNIGDKIHLINGYARQNSSGGVNVSKGKYGSLRKL